MNLADRVTTALAWETNRIEAVPDVAALGGALTRAERRRATSTVLAAGVAVAVAAALLVTSVRSTGSERRSVEVPAATITRSPEPATPVELTPDEPAAESEAAPTSGSSDDGGDDDGYPVKKTEVSRLHP